MNIQEAALALHADWSGGNPVVAGVSTDSRTLKPGDLFVALSGEHFDGHRFILDAIEKGAVAAMISSDVEVARSEPSFAWLRVHDTRLGLGQLAANWRSRFTLPLVAVTGSNGKTTVKEMLASIFRQEVGAANVLATSGNLNNEIGVPQMLLRLDANHAYAVIEMGMNHSGEISYLTGLAAPTVAVITNAGTAHIAQLGSTEAIALAKGEVFEGLSELGVAVINADDSYAPLWRKLAGDKRVVNFGMNENAEISAHPTSHPSDNKWSLRFPDGQVEVVLRVPGRHNVYNALAAAAAANAAGVGIVSIAEGLHAYSGMSGRLQTKQGIRGSTLIDDTYNANPESMWAALAVLTTMPGKKILVMGDMGELGADATELHRRIGQQARATGVEVLLALGELSAHAVAEFGRGAQHFENMDDLLTKAESCLGVGVALLVKGSRFMRMERVIEQLKA